ncbi:MAG: RNA-binding S4 domain-containing protein [Bacilli bacterium]
MKIYIKGDFIQLNKLLKYAGIISTGGEAKFFIEDNDIKLNGNSVYELRKKIRVGDNLTINNNCITIFEEK